ncbi:hypothetical protein TOPH_01452 [Tolypocladium ophioglossoides CBS 100239]|uniref:BZIP domain-containing protein n=1 Tax=Tolypocladium ophioglossoides (strain CBS 100239) TaxID=1163406 RepID=A0A0L0NI45_TOLOC|nr:hypothetical protein TOPH_01452 [Tolypocladium ophioglossoides CBS 100239]
MAGSTAATPPHLALSPLPEDSTNTRQKIASPPSPSAKGNQKAPSSSAAAAPSGTAPAVAAASPARAPLPNKQPKAPAAKAAVAPAALPRLSLPPVDKMAMAAVISPNPAPEAPKMTMTSKEWVIPPRPKPGRKPATDTPPTKRKAQNRAAQRAFRERRAARVGELEIQLDEQREDHEKQEADLKDKIRGLELDLQSFRSRCMLLENMLDRERQERIRAETQAETLKRRHGEDFFRASSMSGPHRHAHDQQHNPTHHSQRHSMSDARQLQHASGRNFSISQIITPPDSMDMHSQHDEADAPLTCGNCSPSGPCACAEEVLASANSGCGKCGFGVPCQCIGDIENAVGPAQDLKRPLSPSNPSSGGKRQRSNAGALLDTETDFTVMFSRKSAADSAGLSPYQMPPSDPQIPSANSVPFKDSCGFCKDGTYCMCAEDAAMATPAMTPTAETLPPISHQTQTPPPSEPDIHPPPLVMEMTADGAVKLPRRTQAQPHKKPTKTNSRACGANGPGTCAQCQADPKSGLFCRLMAAKFDREQGDSSGGGYCSGKGAGAGCCKAAPEKEKITLPSLPSLGLSCAEAYQTLSSHRNFDRAADDISSWLPKLKATTPNGSVRIGAHRGRQAIEVEAASIMSVLKEFDVRFGREC